MENSSHFDSSSDLSNKKGSEISEESSEVDFSKNESSTSDIADESENSKELKPTESQLKSKSRSNQSKVKYNDYNFSNQISSTQTPYSQAMNEIENDRNKILTKENKELKEKINDYELIISNLEMKSNGLLIQLGEAKSEISQLQSNQKQKTIDSNLQEKDTSKNDGAKSLDELHNYVKLQSNEISSLIQQREEFMKLYQLYNSVNSKSEDIIINLNETISKLQQKQTKGQDNYTNLEKQFSEKLEENQQRLNELYEYVYNNSTQAIQEQQNDMTEELIYDKLKSIVEMNMKSMSDKGDIKEREKALHGHLENAVKFIEILVNTNSQTKGKETKTMILSQCARINQYLVDQYGIEEIEPVVNLFEAGDPETQIQTFYDFIDENDISNTPTQELYTLFCATIYVNNMLFNHLDSMQERMKIPNNKIREVQDENQRLRRFYDDVSIKLEGIADQISDYISIGPNEDVFDMISSFINGCIAHMNDQNDASNQNDKNHQQYNDESNSVSQLNNNKSHDMNMDDLRLSRNNSGGSSNKNDQRSHNSKKNDDYKILALKLKAKYLSEKEKHEKSIHKLKKTIHNLKNKLNEANESLEEAKISENALNDKINSLSIELKKQIKQNNELTFTITKLNEHNSSILKSTDQSTNDSNKKIQKMQTYIQELEQQIQNLECKTNRINQHNRLNDDLQTQYNNRIRSLESDLSKALESNEELTEKVSAMTKQKNELLQQVTKYKVSERSLNLKISQMQEYIKFKEDQNNIKSKAQVLSINTENEKKLRKSQEKVHKNEMLLKCLIEGQFNIQIKKDTTYEEMITILEKEIAKGKLFFSTETLQDAEEIRKKLNMKNTDSLLDAFNDLLLQRENENQNYEVTKEENKNIQKQLEECQSDIKNVNSIKSKLNEWETWATKMFSQIAEGSAPSHQMNDIRYALEESLLTTIGHRTTCRKMHLLRVQKALLCNFYEEVKPSQTKKKIQSMKPFMCMILFIRRLQGYSGCFPPDYRAFTIQKNSLK
ncbi:hypothetical protein TRFO_13532 [Tritrichomonas foetus]|uniref:Uncharacterized protein n=1 Tax=Tritrichomonas foetus TaxID=1144522 RepID=A0A1J4KYT5_9EUKA|nr:hypothetical protein TRFO_13532 [Tritrichomonas foetus]|eukprot:OHT16040.1 hypothetical protein TRFO_13532 [Tritrichomonas foetus]